MRVVGRGVLVWDYLLLDSLHGRDGLSVSAERIDLGHDHFMSFCCWAPDRALNPQYEGVPDVEKYSVWYEHKKPNGEDCLGAITLDGEVARAIAPNQAKWTVESWDPFTVSPSLLCMAPGCGDHGFIRGGRWVPA